MLQSTRNIHKYTKYSKTFFENILQKYSSKIFFKNILQKHSSHSKKYVFNENKF